MADYDVIVIGGGLGGISAAALCAKNGFKTVMFEQCDVVGGCCSSFDFEGYRFDTGASIIMLTETIQAIFELMGRRMEDYIELFPCDPIYQVIGHDGSRFNMPMDIAEATSVIERVAPGDVEGWKEFTRIGLSMLEAIGDMMMTPMNTLQEMARMQSEHHDMMRYMQYFLLSHQSVTQKFFKDPVMQSFVGFQSYYAGAPPYLGLGILGFIALMQHLGSYYPKGGMIALPGSLQKVGEEFGLEVRSGTKVEKIIVESGRARGVRLEDGSVVSSKMVLSNANAKVTYLKMVGPEHLKPWAIRAIDSYELSMPIPMIYVGIDTKPPLPAHHTICTGPLEEANRNWHDYYKKGINPEPCGSLLSWPTESDPELAPEGHHVLNFVWGGPYPYAPLGDNWDRLKPAIKESAVKELERIVMPDIADHIKVMEVSTPLDFERRLLSPQGAIYGLFLDITTMSLFRPNPRSRVVKDLYLSGASTCMGGGVPTTLASGVIASNYILEDHG
jgi:phytoene desaturase